MTSDADWVAPKGALHPFMDGPMGVLANIVRDSLNSNALSESEKGLLRDLYSANPRESKIKWYPGTKDKRGVFSDSGLITKNISDEYGGLIQRDVPVPGQPEGTRVELESGINLGVAVPGSNLLARPGLARDPGFYYVVKDRGTRWKHQKEPDEVTLFGKPDVGTMAHELRHILRPPHYGQNGLSTAGLYEHENRIRDGYAASHTKQWDDAVLLWAGETGETDRTEAEKSLLEKILNEAQPERFKWSREADETDMTKDGGYWHDVLTKYRVEKNWVSKKWQVMDK